MQGNNRARHVGMRHVSSAVLLLGVGACTPLVGGAALLGVISIGALTSRCYDYLDVTVLDAEGRKTCAARVTASRGSSHFDLSSCYYASLTDGRWNLRASLPGLADAVTSVEVSHPHDCTRYVQSVELTLKQPALTRSTAPAVPSAAPPATPPLSPAASPSATPGPEPAATPPNATSAAPPMTSAAPSVGVFPDSPPTN